jgi:hypothetical protein
VPLAIDKERQYFADVAKKMMTPAAMPAYSNVPDSLIEAAELWLAVRKPEMSPTRVQRVARTQIYLQPSLMRPGMKVYPFEIVNIVHA